MRFGLWLDVPGTSNFAVAGERLDREALLGGAADPDLLRRAHLHPGLDRLAGRDLVRRAVKAEVELVVVVLALEATSTGALALFSTATS